MKLNVLNRFTCIVDKAINEICTGRFWWRGARYFAGLHLSWLLEKSGDVSFAARQTTEQYRRLEFAVTHWGMTPRPVMKVIQIAELAGVPRKVLQLVVLNNRIRVIDGKISLYRHPLILILSAAMAALVVFQYSLMLILIISGPGSVAIKILLTVTIVSIYSILYRGWTLYTLREIKAFDRFQHMLDPICRQANRITDKSPAIF